MSLFAWLFDKRKKVRTEPESSGLSRMEATRPVNGRAAERVGQPADNAQPANRKNERMARRELLYAVVRECMMRAGVLSASYKFKVLSLDARGRQFLVMVDLARDSGGETARLAEIEAAIAQAAKHRFDILVTSVYWRLNEHVAIGAPGTLAARGTPSRPVPLESRPAPLDPQPQPLALPEPVASPELASVAAPDAARPAAMPPAGRPAGARFEPIAADEVAAFRQALAAGIGRPGAARPAAAVAGAAAAATAGTASATARTFEGVARSGPQSYTLLTGFEDTEMPEPSDHRIPALSGTQYGDLN